MRNPQRPVIFLLFSFCGAQRALTAAEDTTGVQAFGRGDAYKVTERGHRGKLGSAGCWSLSQQGIYAQLSSGLFNADAQVWEQFVIGRFMAYKHIV